MAAVMRDTDDDNALSVSIESRVEEEVRKERMSWFFYDNRTRAAKDTSHLRKDFFNFTRTRSGC